MEKYKECKICNNVYNYQCGEFSNHIEKEHRLNREQYVVITEYNSNHPKCQCGYCDDDSAFILRKNSFHNINSEHRKFDWIEKKYIEKYGIPICKECNNSEVKFHRGKPNTYCSLSCKPSSWNQEKVSKTVKERYGVDNVMKIQLIKTKVSSIFKNNKKAKSTKKERYGDENYCNIEKAKNTCMDKFGVDSYSKTDKFREQASKTAIKTNSENKITIKPYKKTNLYYQGTYEFRFLEYCEKNNIFNLIERSKSFNYLPEDLRIGHRHLPDFLFKDKYIIEIKSTYILEKQGGWDVINAKKRSVEKSGYEYILVLDNKFDTFNKINKNESTNI